MNHVATPVAPSERIRGATSEPDTSPPMSPPGGGRGMESGRMRSSRQACSDRTGDLSKLTTVERRFNGRRGTRVHFVDNNHLLVKRFHRAYS